MRVLAFGFLIIAGGLSLGAFVTSDVANYHFAGDNG